MMSDKLRELSGRRPTNMHHRDNPETSEEEEEDSDEVLQKVLQMSLEQQARDEERRRMAGLGVAEATGISEADEEGLAEWLNSSFPSRVQSAVNAASDPVPTKLAAAAAAEQTIEDALPLEEQLRLIRELSQRKYKEAGVASAKSTFTLPPGPDELFESEEEMLKKALELSLDPNEQRNEDLQSLLKAVQESEKDSFVDLDARGAAALSFSIIPRGHDRSSPGAAAVTAAAFSEAEQIENDAEFARTLELSRQEFAWQKMREELDEEKAIDAVNKKGKGSPRPIIIDGNNVAFNHGNHQKFSAKAIIYCYQYFLEKGHSDITAFCTPGHGMSEEDRGWVKRMSDAGLLKQVGRKRYGNEVIGHYDDLYILKGAKENDGIIVSNDHFRDILETHPELAQTIKTRVLPFQFVNDIFIPAEDPLGRNGPNLKEFLRF